MEITANFTGDLEGASVSLAYNLVKRKMFYLQDVTLLLKAEEISQRSELTDNVWL